MSNRHFKTKPQPGGDPAGEASGTGVNDFSIEDYSTIDSALQPHRRRPLPVEGALLKLDIIERHLHVANTVGDMAAYGRWYGAWIRLHPLAFGYGRWAKGVSNEVGSDIVLMRGA